MGDLERFETTKAPSERPLLVDASGRSLCSHAVWGRKCRWGKMCSFSHKVPPDLARAYQGKAQSQIAAVNMERIANIPEVKVPPWLSEIQAAAGAFPFDVRRWPFLELLRDLLGDGHAEEQLSELHGRSLDGEPPLCPTLLQAYACARGLSALPASWRDAIAQGRGGRRAMLSSDKYERFRKLYREFCAEVILPLVGASSAYVQEPPTLRVHLAGQAQAQGKIGMHKDADYPGHCAAEVNFWLPVTQVGGANSLFVESAEGRDDFRPLELCYGELYRFHGYSCRHHTVTNDTGATRVSFDFRVVPATCCPPTALCGARCGRRGLRIGDYPAVLVSR